MKEQRTLCHSCVQDYEEAGYYLKRDYSDKYKDRCDICGRMGWNWFISRDTAKDKKFLREERKENK